MREGARIDKVTGSPWSRDINVNGKEKRQGEDRRREYEVRPEGFLTRGGGGGGGGAGRSRIERGERRRQWRRRQRQRQRRDEVSSFSLLFPLIKISNMITADLATIIERLAVEFAVLALAS